VTAVTPLSLIKRAVTVRSADVRTADLVPTSVGANDRPMTGIAGLCIGERRFPVNCVICVLRTLLPLVAQTPRCESVFVLSFVLIVPHRSPCRSLRCAPVLLCPWHTCRLRSHPCA
jgi:hypothetical protein